MDVDSTSTPKIEETKEKLGQPSASAEAAAKYPKMDLAQRIHRLTMMSSGKLERKEISLQEDVKKEILEEIKNPSLYRSLMSTLDWGSSDKLQEMDDEHAMSMKKFEEKVEEAKENAGDMEVLDARLIAARYAAKSLSKDSAVEMYEKVLDLPKLSTGKKIDALMECARVASFYGDLKKNTELIEKVRSISLSPFKKKFN